MRMYLCTFPRMRTLKFCSAAFVLLLAGLPSSAQNGQGHGNSSQAELHISVIVAPVILPPRRDRDRDHNEKNEGMVSYNLGAQDTQLSITKEVRPMMVSVNGATAEKQPVQLTTVVVQ